MEKAKKVEIVIESINVHHVISLIDSLKLPGYSVISGVAGRGVHGEHDAQGLTDVSTNSYVIIVCSHEQSQELVNKTRPILQRYGGICLLSAIEEVVP